MEGVCSLSPAMGYRTNQAQPKCKCTGLDVDSICDGVVIEREWDGVNYLLQLWGTHTKFMICFVLMTVLSGLIPAVKHQFPTSRHKRRYFHMCQAIWWRVADVDGLQRLYIVRDENAVHGWNIQGSTATVHMKNVRMGCITGRVCSYLHVCKL